MIEAISACDLDISLVATGPNAVEGCGARVAARTQPRNVRMIRYEFVENAFQILPNQRSEGRSQREREKYLSSDTRFERVVTRGKVWAVGGDACG